MKTLLVAIGLLLVAHEPAAAQTPAPACSVLDSIADEVFGGSVIRYTLGRPIVVVVILNGRTPARLILDTGSNISTVKPSLLRAAGVDLAQPSRRGDVRGITGKAEAVSSFPVDFAIAVYSARVPQVVALNPLEADAAFSDGLLGRDFLDHLKVTIDPAAGTVTLAPRGRSR